MKPDGTTEHVLGNSSHTQSQIPSGFLAAHPSCSLAPPGSPPPPHSHSCSSPRVATRCLGLHSAIALPHNWEPGCRHRRVEITPMSHSTPPHPRQASPQQVQQVTWQKTSPLSPIQVLRTVSWELVAHALQVGAQGHRKRRLTSLLPARAPHLHFAVGPENKISSSALPLPLSVLPTPHARTPYILYLLVLSSLFSFS